MEAAGAFDAKSGGLLTAAGAWGATFVDGVADVLTAQRTVFATDEGERVAGDMANMAQGFGALGLVAAVKGGEATSLFDKGMKMEVGGSLSAMSGPSGLRVRALIFRSSSFSASSKVSAKEGGPRTESGDEASAVQVSLESRDVLLHGQASVPAGQASVPAKEGA